MNGIIDFIKRRFPTDCNWLNGNCYYFAQILLARFPCGKIYYDVIDGHFLFCLNNHFYDWTGERQVNIDNLIDWSTYQQEDPKHYARIVRDVIL